jgi:hypothetical protein
MSDPQMALGLFLLLLQAALPLGMLVLVFLIVRALLRLVVRLVHAEWSRCEGQDRDPVAHGSVAPDGRERGSQQNRAGIPRL